MRRILVFVACLILPSPLSAQEALYEKGEYPEGGQVLPYRLLKPMENKAGEKYPLVLFLHGAGERGTDNKAQLIHGSTLFTDKANRAKFPCFVLFPQCPPGKRWVEVDWGAKNSHTQPKGPSEPMRLTHGLLEQLLKDQPIDEKRIYVMGLSMGGFGTWDFAARYPERIAAAVPICGGADDSTAPRLKDIPVWAFHGSADTVVWPQRSRTMVEALRGLKADVRYTEYEKVGHNSWAPAFREGELLAWMFAQKKG